MTGKSVLTIGFFDGVHAGHRKLIETTINEAKSGCYRAVLLTFDKSLERKPFLTSLEEKLEILKTSGFDELDVVKFTKEFSRMSPEEFFRRYLIKKHNIAKIIIGYDFRFGKNRSGDKELLEKLCKKTGCALVAVQPITIIDKNMGKKVIVSSSFIRKCLSEGRIEFANEMLCRNYSVEGKIVKGKGIGRTLGFPTANIKTDKNKLLPRGVFSGYVIIDGVPYSSVASIGYNPTVSNEKKLTCEVHIMNQKVDLKNDCLKFFFYDKIRNEKKFRNRCELKNQITKDILLAGNNRNNSKELFHCRGV